MTLRTPTVAKIGEGKIKSLVSGVLLVSCHGRAGNAKQTPKQNQHMERVTRILDPWRYL